MDKILNIFFAKIDYNPKGAFRDLATDLISGIKATVLTVMDENI